MPRIRYSDEVRQRALALVLESKQPAAQVARDIGCSVNTIHLWLKQHRQQDAHQSQTISALTEEVRRLTMLMKKFFGKSSGKLPKKDETPEKQASKDLTGTPGKKEKNGGGGLNEFAYLCDVLDRLADLGSEAELHALLPDRWTPKS